MIRVIGIGSPFGDDDLGWRVAEALRQSEVLAPYFGRQLQITESDRPGAQLLNDMKGVDTVIVVDAMLTDEGGSHVQQFSVDDLRADTGLLSSHGFGVVQALELGRSLGELPEEVVVIGVPVEFDGGTRPHKVPGQGVNEAAQKIISILLQRLIF